MLGKLKGSMGALKDKAEGPVLQGAIAKLAPELTPHLEKLKALDPATVRDDALFKNRFITPTALALAAASGGVTSMIPGFNDRFVRGMLHVRNELIVIDESSNNVSLTADFTSRLPKVLLEGFKQPA